MRVTRADFVPTIADATGPIAPIKIQAAPASAPITKIDGNNAKSVTEVLSQSAGAPNAVASTATAAAKADLSNMAQAVTAVTAAAPAPASTRARDATPAPALAPKDWLDARVAADFARIEKQPGTRFSVQLLTADQSSRTAIEAYLRTASKELNPDRIMLYLSGSTENPKVSVLYGNYTDRAEATSEMSALSPKVTQFRPYARSFQAIRDDLRKLPQ